jgi:hypothetical protein
MVREKAARHSEKPPDLGASVFICGFRLDEYGLARADLLSGKLTLRSAACQSKSYSTPACA